MTASEASLFRETLMRAIDGVPWDYLAHAYGSASDAREHLRCFVLAELPSDELESAVEWMWGSILHQGNVYSASPPVIWILVDLLAAFPEHPAASAILGGLERLADSLLSAGDYDESTDTPVRCSAPGEPAWEAWVTAPLPRTIGDGDRRMYFEAFHVRSSCIAQTVNHAAPLAARCLDHPSEDARNAAAAALWSVDQIVANKSDAPGRFRGMIGNARFDPGVWLSAIMALDLLHEDVGPLLLSPDRRIRLGAAMAKGTRGVASSRDELASALRDLDWLEQAFPAGLAHRDMHLRFHVLSALLERCSAETADATVIEALRHVIAQRASPFTADFEWAPILRWAFPDRLAKLPIADEDMLPLPQRLNEAQRVVLDALSRKSDLWNPKWGNASLALRWVQLPHDRTRILQCLAASG